MAAVRPPMSHGANHGASPVTSFVNRMSHQPESYDKKSKYRMGKTLGAGTYGIVREADCAAGKVAVKIILKKNVKGNEQMVYDELEMLQRMQHPHIVRFHDWFESKDKYYIVTQLATGGELFDRICERGKFTEKDASQTIRQVLGAVDYLHDRNVVHRDLKPENLLYLTKEPNSSVVLADFGIAKMLDSKDEVLTTMAGSFGYAAPEVMMRTGHGRPADMWSMGVITYTLLCGYSPFRSEGVQELVEECQSNKIIFHERYWKDVSPDAKDFIRTLLQADPHKRATSKEAIKHRWLTGATATDHNLLSELRSRQVRARMRLAIDKAQIARSIETLRAQEDQDPDDDIPRDSQRAAEEAMHSRNKESPVLDRPGLPPSKSSSRLTKNARGALFRAVVFAKVKEIKQQREAAEAEQHATTQATRHSV